MKASRDELMNEYNLMGTSGALIRRAHQLHDALWSQLVGGDLTSAQFAVLTAARRLPGIDQTQLSVETALDTSTVQAIVVRLVKREWLERVRSQLDQRKYEVRVTEGGKAAIDAVLPAVRSIPDVLLKELTAEERGVLQQLLLKIVEAPDCADTAESGVPRRRR